jgi:hypothetical protein
VEVLETCFSRSWMLILEPNCSPNRALIDSYSLSMSVKVEMVVCDGKAASGEVTAVEYVMLVGQVLLGADWYVTPSPS